MSILTSVGASTSLFFVFLAMIAYISTSGAVSDDGSVCFNDCNGHGACVDYTCHCSPGFHGDDCGTTFAPGGGENIIPVLGAGHFNVTTKKQLNELLRKQSKDMAALVLGFSSSNCHRCITVENEYDELLSQLLEDGGVKVMDSDVKSKGKSSGKGTYTSHQVLFGRVDVTGSEAMKELAFELGATDIPSIVVFPTVKSASRKEKKGVLYRGHHTSADILRFIQKLLSPPVLVLKSARDTEHFLVTRGRHLSSDSDIDGDGVVRGLRDDRSERPSCVVGFFSSHRDMEEDEYEEFVEVAKALRTRDDLHFGVVTDKGVVQAFKDAKIIDRSPSMVLYTPSAALLDDERPLTLSSTKDKNNAAVLARKGYQATNLDELFADGGNRGGVQSWIVHGTVPLVGRLTNSNFQLYSQLNKPMLMLFLDLQRESYITSDSVGAHLAVGGKSGGVMNQDLVNEFVAVAKEHSERFSFVYLDGTTHEDQMRNLGLYGGAARLPSLAFNTKDNLQAPFPEELPLNKDTILSYCAAMISGKLRNAQDAENVAKKALQSVSPINPKNRVTRKTVEAPADAQTGVLEHFDDGSVGDLAVVKLTAASIAEAVFETYEDKDVLLMVHAHSGLCKMCGHFAVYFKKLAERFSDLQLDSLVIARIDVSDEAPPASLKLIGEATLPTMVMLPAGAKYPPWQFYSGVGKVGPMMKWAHRQAGVPFELPNLPHLTVEQKEMYKEQVRERERIRLERLQENDDAMAAMDKQRDDVRRRRELREKREKEGEIELEALDAEDEVALLAELEVGLAGEVPSPSPSVSGFRLGDSDSDSDDDPVEEWVDEDENEDGSSIGNGKKALPKYEKDPALEALMKELEGELVAAQTDTADSVAAAAAAAAAAAGAAGAGDVLAGDVAADTDPATAIIPDLEALKQEEAEFELRLTQQRQQRQERLLQQEKKAARAEARQQQQRRGDGVEDKDADADADAADEEEEDEEVKAYVF